MADHASLRSQDLLRISNQSRPDIFNLNVQRPKVLYDNVLEVDERVTLVGATSDPDFAEKQVTFDESGAVTSGHEGEIVRGVSGEAVRILKKPGAFASSSSRDSALGADSGLLRRRRADHSRPASSLRPRDSRPRYLPRTLLHLHRYVVLALDRPKSLALTFPYNRSRDPHCVDRYKDRI